MDKSLYLFLEKNIINLKKNEAQYSKLNAIVGKLRAW